MAYVFCVAGAASLDGAHIEAQEYGYYGVALSLPLSRALSLSLALSVCNVSCVFLSLRCLANGSRSFVYNDTFISPVCKRIRFVFARCTIRRLSHPPAAAVPTHIHLHTHTASHLSPPTPRHAHSPNNRCVESVCGIRYIREESDIELTKRQKRQQREIVEHLQQSSLLLSMQRKKEGQHPDPSSFAEPVRGTSGVTADTDVHNDIRVGGTERQLHSVGESNGGQVLPVGDAETARDGGERGVAGGEGMEGEGVGEEGGQGGVVDRYVHSPPWHLKMMGWDCESECGYTCMTLHVESRIAAGERVLQYHGKWPFR